MESTFWSIAENSMITKISGIAIDSIRDWIKKQKAQKKEKNIGGNGDFEQKILNHFVEVYNWSNEIEFIGLSKPLNISENTIKLSFSFSLLKTSKDDSVEKFYNNENDLILDPRNIIIEGDPGSGKTTSVKRILYEYFIAKTENDYYQYPILVRLRSIEPNKDLYRYICDNLGIPYRESIEEVDFKFSDSNVADHQVVRGTKGKKTKHLITYYIGEEKINKALQRYFEENRILLILDGLDEVHSEIAEKIQKQIKEICLNINQSKVIVTTRPNYIKKTFVNTSTYQIEPLSEIQIKSIISLWLPQDKGFYKQLKTKAYFELANRPLFLCFLILLYKNQKQKKTLPSTSKEVYERIIELLIKRWDLERDVERVSAYKNFDPSRKMEFLTHFSYHLTYITKEKSFSHEIFLRIYKTIRDRFELPENQASEIAEEIEGHTGIIIRSTHGKYEFSHLSIQEYLCARFLSTAAFNSVIDRYLETYPEPIAIAIGLSGDPTEWMYELVCKIDSLNKGSETCSMLYAKILNRLRIETPYFEPTSKLALCIIKICLSVNIQQKDFIISLVRFVESNKNVALALEGLLKRYRLGRQYPSDSIVKFYKDNALIDELYPYEIAMPVKIMECIQILNYPIYW